MEKFFELLKISLGVQDQFSFTPTTADWQAMLEEAARQTLLGVCFSAVERLPENQRPDSDTLVAWYDAVAHLEDQNKEVTRLSVGAEMRFAEDHFKSCVIKGQGVAENYPQPLRRHSGDIDIWVVPEGKRLPLLKRRRQILNYVRKFCPDGQAAYHHVDFLQLGETNTEVHFTPTWLCCPKHNKRLQQWLESQIDRQFAHQVQTPYGPLVCPTNDFNLVFLLLHIYRHLFAEGVGMRQLMDYYYALQQSDVDSLRNSAMNTLRSFGMERFTKAVMWVLQETMGLEYQKMLVAPNEKDGQFLLGEVMRAGNFGFYDSRSNVPDGEGPLHRFVRVMGRNLRFVRYYPSEVLWSPIFKMWHRIRIFGIENHRV